MKLDRYKANRRGLLDLLGSESVHADLTRRALAIAAAAQAGYDADPPHEGAVEVVVDGQAGTAAHPRSRVAVIALHPAVQYIEADRRTLGTAMDAGAG